MAIKKGKELATHVRDIAQAYLDGKVIQLRRAGGDVWVDCCGGPRFDFHQREYRVKPAETTYVPWDKVDPAWKWARTLPDGQVILYKDDPITWPSEVLTLTRPVMEAFGIRSACPELAKGERGGTIVCRDKQEEKKDV